MKNYMGYAKSVFEGALRAKEKGVGIDLETYFDSNLRKTDFKIIEKKSLFSSKKTLFALTEDYARQVSNRREIAGYHEALSTYISNAKKFTNSVYENDKDAKILYEVTSSIENVYKQFKDTLVFDEKAKKFVDILDSNVKYTTDYFSEQGKIINVTVEPLVEKQLKFINEFKATLNSSKKQTAEKEQEPA